MMKRKRASAAAFQRVTHHQLKNVKERSKLDAAESTLLIDQYMRKDVHHENQYNGWGHLSHSLFSGWDCFICTKEQLLLIKGN